MRLSQICLLSLLLVFGHGCAQNQSTDTPAGASSAAGSAGADRVAQDKQDQPVEVEPWNRPAYPFGENTYRPTKGYYRIVILHTNDIRGQVQPASASWVDRNNPPKRGGLAIMASAINEIRGKTKKAGKGFLLLDAGNLFSGTPEGAISRGDVVVDYMNRVGYDALTVGHADYDLGKENLQRLAQRAQFPFLGANVIDERQGTNPEFIQPYLIKQVGPFRIGIIGLTTPKIRELSARSNWTGHHFERVRQALDRVVPQLEKQQVDLLVLLSHLGPEGDAQVNEYLKGAAVIIGGSSQQGLAKGLRIAGKGVRAETWGGGTSLGWVELIVSLRTKKLLDAKAHLVNLSPTFFVADKAVGKLVDKTVKQAQASFGKELGRLSQVLGRSAGIESSPLGNFITDALREESGCQIAIIAKRRMLRDLPSGKITLRHLHEVWSTNDRLVRMRLTGRQISTLMEASVSSGDRVLEVSGLKVVYDPNRPAGNRLLRVEYQGKPVDPARDYLVVTTERLSEGGSRMRAFLEGRDKRRIGLLMRSALSRYLVRHTPVRRSFAARLVPARAGAQPTRVKLAVLLAGRGPGAALFNTALRAALDQAEKQGLAETRIELPEFGGDLHEELRVRTRRGQYRGILVVGPGYGPALSKLAPKHRDTQFVWLAMNARRVNQPNVSVVRCKITAALEMAGKQAALLKSGGRLGLLTVAETRLADRVSAAFAKGYAAQSKPAGVVKATVKPDQEAAADAAGALAKVNALLGQGCDVIFGYCGLSTDKIQAAVAARKALFVGLGQGDVQVAIDGQSVVRTVLSLTRRGKGLRDVLQLELGSGVLVVRRSR